MLNIILLIVIMLNLNMMSVVAPGSWSCLQTIQYAGKAWQGQTLQRIAKFINYGRKKFYNIGPWTRHHHHETFAIPFLF